jgi:hypothetical protein
MPASSSPICSRAPASIAWPPKIAIKSVNCIENQASSQLKKKTPPTKQLKIIDEIGRKSSSATASSHRWPKEIDFTLPNLPRSSHDPDGMPPSGSFCVCRHSEDDVIARARRLARKPQPSAFDGSAPDFLNRSGKPLRQKHDVYQRGQALLPPAGPRDRGNSIAATSVIDP